MSSRFWKTSLLTLAVSTLGFLGSAFAEVSAADVPASLDQNQISAQAPVAPAFVKPEPLQVQKALAQAGFYKGKVDGIAGKRTRAAVRAFQQANGLKVDGRVGPATWEKLNGYLPTDEMQAASEPSLQGQTSAGIPLDPQAGSGTSQELKQKLVS